MFEGRFSAFWRWFLQSFAKSYMTLVPLHLKYRCVYFEQLMRTTRGRLKMVLNPRWMAYRFGSAIRTVAAASVFAMTKAVRFFASMLVSVASLMNGARCG